MLLLFRCLVVVAVVVVVGAFPQAIANNNNNKESLTVGASLPNNNSAVNLTVVTSNNNKTATDGQGKTLIAVITAPGHSEVRQAIRNSWGSYFNNLSPNYDSKIANSMSLKFFIGELSDSAAHLESSISLEQDIVRLHGFVESYGNLSAKTLGVITWASDNNYGHVLKIDDDVFLQPDLLLDFISTQFRIATVYAGEFTTGANVNDNPKSKWYMRDQYKHDTYPSYAFGSCYFVGRDIVRRLANQRKELPLYRVEDAGLAIWLQQGGYQDVMSVDMENMYFQADCFDNYAVFTTPVNTNEMGLLQKNKQNNGICGDTFNPVILEECVTRRCRCYPLPEEGPCETEMANEEYKDLIPRLVQIENKAVAN